MTGETDVGDEIHTHDPGPCPTCGSRQRVSWIHSGEDEQRDPCGHRLVK
jgi:hypothetical protein